VEDDPSLLVPFEGLVVKAKCKNNHAIVLVCDSDGKMTLMEDVGCTIKIDYKAEESARACKFSIQVEAACK
jgi:NADPH-dependent curcumin reductase CurA